MTGGSGYLASWIVRFLLEDGYNVNTTVRNLADQSRYEHLIKISERNPGMLRFFEADLLKEGSFDEAAKECEVVIHTASPFKLTGIKDGKKELLKPAVLGVNNVFNASFKSGTVRRIVMTSSIAAVYGDATDIRKNESGVFDETDWNTTSSVTYQPYSYSKTMAEKEAWKLVAQHPATELNVINPGFIMGPSLTGRMDSTSISVMNQFISGNFRSGLPNGMQAIADVRDIARAHILAAFTPLSGYRFIAAPHSVTFSEMAAIIRKKYPDLPIPKRTIPTWFFLLAGPLMGFPARFILRNIGYKIEFNNALIREKLGIEFRPLEETLLDHIKQLLASKVK